MISVVIPAYNEEKGLPLVIEEYSDKVTEIIGVGDRIEYGDKNHVQQKDIAVTVVIPAYNEEKSIGTCINKVKYLCPNADIIVINDGSTDKTEKIARELKVEIITHEVNRGYGAALKTGLKKANSNYVAFLDADLTYNPKYIPLLLKHAKREGVDCVWGNRFGGKVCRMPLIRKIGNKIIVLVFFLVTFKKIDDCTSGERLLSRYALEKLDIDTLPNDLDFITALTKRIVKRKLKCKEIPIDYEEREGSSKLNIFKHGYKMLKNVLIEK